jgi:predicted porin
MNVLKSILLAGAAVALAGAAQAADLPTKKGAAAPPPKANCYATFWSWLDSTPADCPLSYWGVTFYGQIDVGGGWESNAAKFNKAYPNGVSELVSKQNHGAAWQWVPNGLSQSNVGIKWKEQIFASDWYFIGDVNAGFDPYSLQYSNGPRSLIENNNKTLINQTANGDSSRAYGPVNARAYAGIQNKTFGTLTYGRQYAFSNDIDNSLYDPFGGAYAFSLIGTTSTLGGGLGDTELARYTNSIKYMYADHNIRVGAMSNIGGYSAGNNSQFGWEGDVGFDWNGFSFDGVYKYAKDAYALSAYGSVAPPFGPDVLKGTIENVSSFVVAGKYKWDRITLFAGYQNERLSNPSDLPTGSVIRDANGGYDAAFGTGVQGAISGATSAFPKPRVNQVVWTGAKFAALPSVDLIFGYYHVWQNDYNWGPTETAATCAANKTSAGGGYAPQGAASSKCAGTEDAISGVVDWRPWKRVDVYAGAMYSKVTGGLANGYFVNDNLAATGGVRLSF